MLGSRVIPSEQVGPKANEKQELYMISPNFKEIYQRLDMDTFPKT